MSAASTCVLFDLDRTLCDTDTVSARVMSALRQLAPDTAAEIESELIANQGSRYDPWAQLEARLPVEQMEILQQQLLTVTESHAIPGARELLAKLDQAGIFYGVITYGNPAYQQLKLQLMGLDAVPYLVTEIPGQKAQLIATWRQSGEFMLPLELGGGAYSRVVLVDDKLDELIPPSEGLTTVLYQAVPIPEAGVDYTVSSLADAWSIVAA